MSNLTVSVGTFKTGEVGFLVLKDGFQIETGYVPGDLIAQVSQGIRIASKYCTYGDSVILETKDKVLYNRLSSGTGTDKYLSLLDDIDNLPGSFGTRYAKNTAVSRYRGAPPTEIKRESFADAFTF